MSETYSNGKSRFIITLMNFWHFRVKVKITSKIFKLWMFLNVQPELFHKSTLKSKKRKALQKVMKNIYQILVINSRKLFKGPCNEGQVVAVVSCILSPTHPLGLQIYYGCWHSFGYSCCFNKACLGVMGNVIFILEVKSSGTQWRKNTLYWSKHTLYVTVLSHLSFISPSMQKSLSYLNLSFIEIMIWRTISDQPAVSISLSALLGNARHTQIQTFHFLPTTAHKI